MTTGEIAFVNLVADTGESISGEALREAMSSLFAPMLAQMRKDRMPAVAVLVLGSGLERAIVSNAPTDIAMRMLMEVVIKHSSGEPEASGTIDFAPVQ